MEIQGVSDMDCLVGLRVRKRKWRHNGAILSFNRGKIEEAVKKAVIATYESPPYDPNTFGALVADGVMILLADHNNHGVIYIEDIQNCVEMVLSEFDPLVYRAYCDFRKKRAQQRKLDETDILTVRKFEDEEDYLPTDYQRFIFHEKYARYIEALGRRETWQEAVERTLMFLRNESNKYIAPQARFTQSEWDELEMAMLNGYAFPSLRVFQMAGPALERCNVGVYNCSFRCKDGVDALVELLYICMQGTGVGFSVQDCYVDGFPVVAHQKNWLPLEYVVPDSTEGWCDAFKIGLQAWFEGRDVNYDFSLIRPQGARLKTKGGYASGPGPLQDLLEFSKRLILAAQGRKLKPVEIHDIACKAGQIVQVGGVRRSALMSLSDLFDEDMAVCKTGEFWIENSQRFMSNNSAVFTQYPSPEEFWKEWCSLATSGTGERGIFNLYGIRMPAPFRRDASKIVGVNPCGEINLRNKQFCNLTQAIARPHDSEEVLKWKVRLAVRFGKLQSLLTNFKYISPEWAKNCIEERLLGVDISGQQDCLLLNHRANRHDVGGLKQALKLVAIEEDRVLSARFNVAESTAITTGKPAGNSSQLFDCSSGTAPRFASYYMRRVRVASFAPMARFLIDSGMTPYPETGYTLEDAPTYVFEFPIAAPESAVLREEMSALDQLQYVVDNTKYYTEHNTSCTIFVKPHEWATLGKYVYDNFKSIRGVSFLPYDGGQYKLAPYEEITKTQYEEAISKQPHLDFSKFARYEKTDTTERAQDYACVGGGSCELP